MQRRTFVRPEAQTDIREAARWYEDREPGLRLRFLPRLALLYNTSTTIHSGFRLLKKTCAALY